MEGQSDREMGELRALVDEMQRAQAESQRVQTEMQRIQTENQETMTSVQRTLEGLTNLVKAIATAGVPPTAAPQPPPPPAAPTAPPPPPPVHNDDEDWYVAPDWCEANRQMGEAAVRPPVRPNPPAATVTDQQSANEKQSSLEDKIARLEEQFQRSKDPTSIGLDMDRYLLFPEVKLPDKFKFPDIPKFNGVGDPNAHLMSYVGTLRPMGLCSKLLAQSFHRTLTNDALKWFMDLDMSKKKSWMDIGTAFVQQFSYTVEMKMTIRELEATKMEPKEGFADFMTR